MTIKADNDGNPILNQSIEEGFVDLTFRLTNLVDVGGYSHFRLSASHNKQIVGMDVEVVKGVQGGFDQDMKLVKENVYKRGVRFLRSGVESDRLISAICEFYGLPSVAKQMVEEETFTAIALHRGELNMDYEPVKLKLFGKDTKPVDQDAYYESFFNLDLLNGFVFWNEKDPEYRRPLARALGVY